MKTAILFTLLAAVVGAQVKPPETLSATEKIALQSIQQEEQRIQQQQQQLVQELRSIETDVTKQHPGYHLDERTLALVKDAPTTKK